MGKYKVTKTKIMEGLIRVNPMTEMYIDIEGNHLEFYSYYFMSTTREEIEHYISDNYDKFIELPKYKEIGFTNIANKFIDSLNIEELSEKYYAIDDRYNWIRIFHGLLSEYNVYRDFYKTYYLALKPILEEIIIKEKDKIDVIDDMENKDDDTILDIVLR